MNRLRILLGLSTLLACLSCTHQQQVALHKAADYGNVACAIFEPAADSPYVDVACNVIDQVDQNTPKKVTMRLSRPAAFKLGLVRSPTSATVAPSASVAASSSASH